MRIDAYNQISQIYRTGGKSKTGKTNQVYGSDRVEISQFGKDFQIAKRAVAEAPDIREDLTTSVKSQIESGTYNPSTDELAAKLAEKYGTNIF